MNLEIRKDLALKLLQWHDSQRDSIYQLGCMLQKEEFDEDAHQQLIKDTVFNLKLELKQPVVKGLEEDDNNGIGLITKAGVKEVKHLINMLHVLGNSYSYDIIEISEDPFGFWTITSDRDETLFIQNVCEQKAFIKSVIALDASLQTNAALIKFIAQRGEAGVSCAIGKDTWQSYTLED